MAPNKAIAPEVAEPVYRSYFYVVLFYFSFLDRSKPAITEAPPANRKICEEKP